MLIAEFFGGLILIFFIGYVVGRIFKLSSTVEPDSFKKRKIPKEVEEPSLTKEQVEI